MKTMNAREAQSHFSEMMTTVIKEPVTIQKHGRPSAVLISYEEYKKFEQLEDLYWSLRAKQSEEEGYLSSEESTDLLSNILKS